MYNDELAETYSQYAHSKGVVVFDKSDGFWLVHSGILSRLPPTPIFLLVVNPTILYPTCSLPIFLYSITFYNPYFSYPSKY